jgi:hypothetical protein
MSQNLEALIEEHAKVMAEQMVKAVEWARSEEDVRHQCNTLIDEFVRKAGLSIRGRHEYGLAGGRIDSKYGGVVIEYKDPKGSGKITANKNAPGVKAVVQQIKKRFQDLQAKEQVGMERIFGVGCDGATFVFVRLRGNKFDVGDPQPVTPHTVERLLRAILSVGARGVSFTPENLSDTFGSESRTGIAQKGVHNFYQMIHETDSAKAQSFFGQWQILFGEVCGYDIHGQNAKVKKLADHYMVPDPNPAELLFAVHTYYAVFIKLLAAEIVASFSPIGTSTLKKLVSAPTSAKLRDELRALEQGGIWSQLGIHNFLEGDLFSWYLDAWDDRCADAVRAMTRSLDQFDPTTLSVDPAESRDLLKQLYQQLFPRSVRHDLGEYYTPDWLAELVLDELGYDGNPDKRLLDPACGSGTFLVMALNRVKTWYREHRHECGFGEDELLRKALRNIIGFDLNPLAVMAARTNYLMAVRDLLRHAANVELPVYLCDSIMTPEDYSTQGGATLNFLPLKTAVGVFNIPKDVLKDRTVFGRYADLLHACVENDYTQDDFIARLKSEGLEIHQDFQHKRLFMALSKLKKNDGIWARIIKNAFAPLFIGKVDYVAGNPPWVNWESLPEDYRDGMKPLWQQYGLFTLSGSAGRLGGGKKDLSMLFVYSAVDNYLEEGGRLGFVITQSVFKTQGAGDGFRQLRFSKERLNIYLKPIHVHDLSAMQVFEGATNRTAVFVCEKRLRAFSYPVSYSVWRGPSRISQQVSLDEARSLVTGTKLGALPVDPDKASSPWLTAPKSALSGIQKVIGKSDYKAYEGVNTGGLNGCFWIRVIERRPNGDLLIENLYDVGKIKVKHVQTVIEPDLVYPLLRGRDVRRWHAEPSAHIILAQVPKTRRGIPESEMKRLYPKTFAYLKQFEGDPKKPERGTLRGRSLYRLYFKPTDPFYSMYGVGPYTMAKWKVVWPWISSGMRVSAVGSFESRLCIPEHNASFCAFETDSEAYFLCALLSSAAADLSIRSFYSGGGGGIASPDVVKSLQLPAFNANNKQDNILVALSDKCHVAGAKGDSDAVAGLEAEIDRAAAQLWGITDDELRAIQDALAEMSPGKAQAEPEDESDDE